MPAKVYPDPQIPPALRWIVELICATTFPGYNIGTGAKLEDDFRTFAATVNETLPKDILNAVNGVAGAGAGAWVDYFTQAMRKQFLSGKGPLEELSANAQGIEKMLGETNGKVSFTKILLLTQAAELLVELVVAAIMAYFTGGASEAAAMQNVAEAQAFWRVLLKWLVDNVGRPVAISTAMAESLTIIAGLASGYGVHGTDLLQMGIGGAAGGAIFGIGDVMVRNLVKNFITDIKSVLQKDLRNIFNDLPAGSPGTGVSLGDGFSNDLADLVADHAPNLTSMGSHPPPALQPAKVDALANGYGDLFARYFADLLDAEGNRLGADAARMLGSDFGKNIAVRLADLKTANITPILTDVLKNHTAYFNESLSDALTRQFPAAITRSLDEARHSLRRYAAQGLGNAASDFVNGVFTSAVQMAIFDPEHMSFDWKTGLFNIGAGATARYLPPAVARNIGRLLPAPILPDIPTGPPREDPADAQRETSGAARTHSPNVPAADRENPPAPDPSSRPHADLPDVDLPEVATAQAAHIGSVLEGVTARDRPSAAPSTPTVSGPPRDSGSSTPVPGSPGHSGTSTPHATPEATPVGWLGLRPDELSREKVTEAAIALANMPPEDRDAVPALMRPWERARLATDQNFVDTLRTALLGNAGYGKEAKAAEEFVALATQFMIDMPPGVGRPIAGRYVMHEILKVVLQNPDAARTLLLKGHRFLATPKHEQITDLPEFSDQRGVSPDRGGSYSHVRGLHKKTNTSAGEEDLFGEYSSLMQALMKGKSILVHEGAHALHEHVLNAQQKADVIAAYNEMVRAGEGPGGPRYNPNMPGRESYSFQDPEEMFAEATAAWLGAHAGNDPFTGLPNNDRQWVLRNMPKLVPIFRSLFRDGATFGVPLNPRESAQAENSVVLGLQDFWGRVEGIDETGLFAPPPSSTYRRRTFEDRWVNNDPSRPWTGVIFDYDHDHIIRPDRWTAATRIHYFQWMRDPVAGRMAVMSLLPSEAAGSARVFGDGLSPQEVDMAAQVAKTEGYRTILLGGSFAEHTLADTGRWLQTEIADKYDIAILRPRGRIALTSEGPGVPGMLHVDADVDHGEPVGWELIRPNGNGPVRAETLLITGPIRRWEEHYPSADHWLAPFEGASAAGSSEPGSPLPSRPGTPLPDHGVTSHFSPQGPARRAPGETPHPAPALPTVPAPAHEVIPSSSGERPEVSFPPVRASSPAPSDGPAVEGAPPVPAGPPERVLAEAAYGTAEPGDVVARALRQVVRIAREEFLLADVRSEGDLAPVLTAVFGADHGRNVRDLVDLAAATTAGAGREEVSAHDLFRWREAGGLFNELRRRSVAIPEARTASVRRVFDLIELLREGWPVAAERLAGPVGVDDLLPLVRGTLDATADRVTDDHMRSLLQTADGLAQSGHRPTVEALEQYAARPAADGGWHGRSRLGLARRLVSAERGLSPEAADAELRRASGEVKPWRAYARARGRLVRRDPATPMADAVADAVVLQHLVDGRVDLARTGRLRELHVLGELIREGRPGEAVHAPLSRPEVDAVVERVLGPDAAGELPEKVSAVARLAGHQVVPVQTAVRRAAFERLAATHGIGVAEKAAVRAVLGFPRRLGHGRAAELLALQAQVYGRIDLRRTEQLVGLYRLSDLAHSLDHWASREGPLGPESFDRVRSALGTAADGDRAAGVRALADAAAKARLTPAGRLTLPALRRAHWISTQSPEAARAEIERDAQAAEEHAALRRLFGEEAADPVDLPDGPVETFAGLEAVVAAVRDEYADTIIGEPRDGERSPDLQREHLLPVVRRLLDPRAGDVTLHHAKDLAQAVRRLRAQGREVTLANLETMLAPERDRNTWARLLIEGAGGRVGSTEPRTVRIGARRIALTASNRLRLDKVTPDALALQHLLDGRTAPGRRGRIAELYLLGRLLRDGAPDRTGPLRPLRTGDVRRVAEDVLGDDAPAEVADAAAELIRLARKAGTPTLAAVRAAHAIESVPSSRPWRRFTMAGWQGLKPGGSRRARDVYALHRELNEEPAEPTAARSARPAGVSPLHVPAAARDTISYAALNALVGALRVSEPGLRPHGDPARVGDFERLSQEVLRRPATVASVRELAGLAGKAARRGPVTPAAMRTVAAFDALRTELGRENIGDHEAQMLGLRRDLPEVAAEIRADEPDPFAQVVDAIRHLYRGKVAGLEGPIGLPLLRRLVKDVTGDAAITADAVRRVGASWRELRSAGERKTLSRLRARYAPPAEATPATRTPAAGRAKAPRVLTRREPRRVPAADPDAAPGVRLDLDQVRNDLVNAGWNRAIRLTTDGSVPADADKLTVSRLAREVYGRYPEGIEEVLESGDRPWSRGIGALSQIFRTEFAERYRQVNGRVQLDDLAPLLEDLAGPEVAEGAPGRLERIASLIETASGLTAPTRATLTAAMGEVGAPWRELVTRMAAHTGGDRWKAVKAAALWVRLKRADSTLRPQDMARLVEVQERDHPADDRPSPFDLDRLYTPMTRDLLGGADAAPGNLRVVAAQLKAVASSTGELPSRVELRRAAMEDRWNPARPGGDPNRRDPARIADFNVEIPGLSYYRDMPPEDFRALHRWVNDLLPGASISEDTLVKALRSGFGGLRDHRARLPVEVDGKKYLIEPGLHAIEPPATLGAPEKVKLEKRANSTTDVGPGAIIRKGRAAAVEGRGGPVVGEHGFNLSSTWGGGGGYGRERSNEYQRSVGSYNYMKPADDSYNLLVRAFWTAKVSEVDTGRWRQEEWRVNGDPKITDVRLYTPKHLGEDAPDGNLVTLGRDDLAELDLANKHHIVEGATFIGELSQSLRAALGDKPYLFWEPDIAAAISEDTFASLVVPAHTAPAAGDWQSVPRLNLRKGDRWLNIALRADPLAAKKFGAPAGTMQFDQLKQLIEKSAAGETRRWTFKFMTVNKLKLFYGIIANRFRFSYVWSRDRFWSSAHMQTIQRAIRAKDASQVYTLFSEYHPFVSFGDDRTGEATSLALDPVSGSAQIRLRTKEVKGTRLDPTAGGRQEPPNAPVFRTTWWMRGDYGLGHGTPARLTGIENLYDDIVAGGVEAGLLPRAALGPAGRTPWQHLQTLDLTGDALTVDDRLHRNWKAVVEDVAQGPMLRSIDDLMGTGTIIELQGPDGGTRPVRIKLAFPADDESRTADDYMPIDINIGVHTNTVSHTKAFQKEFMPFENIGTDYTDGTDGKPNSGAERVHTWNWRRAKKISDITAMTVMTYLRSEGKSALFDRSGRYSWWLGEEEMGTVEGGAHIWYAQNLLDGDEATLHRPLDTTAESPLLGQNLAGSAVPTRLGELQDAVIGGLGHGHATDVRKGMGNSRFRTDVIRIFAAGTDVSLGDKVVGWSAEPVGKPQILKFPKAYAEANREAQVGRTVEQEKRDERISGTGAGHNPDLSSTSEGNFLATKTTGKATVVARSEGRTDGNYRTATNTLEMALVRTAVRHSVTLPNGNVVKVDGEMVAEFWPDKIFADPEWRNKWDDLTGKAEEFARQVKRPELNLAPPPAFRRGMVGEAGYGSRLGQFKDLGDEVQYVASRLDGPELAAKVSPAVADAPMSMVEMKDGGWSRKFGRDATEYTLILEAEDLTAAKLEQIFMAGGLKSYKRTNLIDGEKDGLLSSDQYQLTGVTPTPLNGVPVSVRGYGSRQSVDGEIGRVAGNMLVMKGFRPKTLAEFGQPALITYRFLKDGKTASFGPVGHKVPATGELIEDISYLLPLEGTTLDGDEKGIVDIPLSIRPAAIGEIAPVDFRVMKDLLRSLENAGGREAATASDHNALTREKLGPDFFDLASSKHYDAVTNGGRTVALPGGVTVRLASLTAQRIYASLNGEFENYDHETQTAGKELFEASRNTAGFLVKGIGEKPGIPVKFLGYLGGNYNDWKSVSDSRGMSSESRIWRRQMRDFFKILAEFSLELTFPGKKPETVHGLVDIGATTEGALGLNVPRAELTKAVAARDDLISKIETLLKAAPEGTKPKTTEPAPLETIAESSRRNDPPPGTDRPTEAPKPRTPVWDEQILRSEVLAELRRNKYAADTAEVRDLVRDLPRYYGELHSSDQKNLRAAALALVQKHVFGSRGLPGAGSAKEKEYWTVLAHPERDVRRAYAEVLAEGPHGAKLSVEREKVFLGPDDRYYLSQKAAQDAGGRGELVEVGILELDTGLMRDHPGESHAAPERVLQTELAVEQKVGEIGGEPGTMPSTPLAEILPAGWRLTAEGEGWLIGPEPVGAPSGSQDQYNVGVWPSAIHRLMGPVAERTYRGAADGTDGYLTRAHLEDARAFADDVAARFFAFETLGYVPADLSMIRPHLDDLPDLALQELRSHVLVEYVLAAMGLNMQVRYGLRKAHAAFVIRHETVPRFKALPERAHMFLAADRAAFRKSFENRFRERIPDYDERHLKLQKKAVPDGGLMAAGIFPTGDYLDSGVLGKEGIGLKRFVGTNVLKNFDTDGGPLAKAVLEIRYYGQHMTDTATSSRYHRELTDAVRELRPWVERLHDPSPEDLARIEAVRAQLRALAPPPGEGPDLGPAADFGVIYRESDWPTLRDTHESALAARMATHHLASGAARTAVTKLFEHLPGESGHDVTARLFDTGERPIGSMDDLRALVNDQSAPGLRDQMRAFTTAAQRGAATLEGVDGLVLRDPGERPAWWRDWMQQTRGYRMNERAPGLELPFSIYRSLAPEDDLGHGVLGAMIASKVPEGVPVFDIVLAWWRAGYGGEPTRRALFGEAAELYELTNRMFSPRFGITDLPTLKALSPPHHLVYDRLVRPQLPPALFSVAADAQVDPREAAALLRVGELPPKGAGTPVTDLQWVLARQGALRLPTSEQWVYTAMWQQASPESYPRMAAGLWMTAPVITRVWPTPEEAMAQVRPQGQGWMVVARMRRTVHDAEAFGLASGQGRLGYLVDGGRFDVTEVRTTDDRTHVGLTFESPANELSKGELRDENGEQYGSLYLTKDDWARLQPLFKRAPIDVVARNRDANGDPITARFTAPLADPLRTWVYGGYADKIGSPAVWAADHVRTLAEDGYTDLVLAAGAEYSPMESRVLASLAAEHGLRIHTVPLAPAPSRDGRRGEWHLPFDAQGRPTAWVTHLPDGRILRPADEVGGWTDAEPDTAHRQVLPGGPAGGSRDVGAEPSASAWPIGREFVVTVPRPGAETARPGPVERSGRAEVVPEVPATATGTDAGKGKGRQEPVTYSRAVTPQRGGGSGSRPVASTYRISGDGQVILPDGSPGGRALDPAGWVRFGADFFHPESGGFLHGDDGWLGRVANADELRAALDDPSLPHFTAVPYRLWVDSAAIYLSPATAGAGPIVRIPLSPDDESGTETLPAPKTAHAPRHEPGGRTAGELVQHFDDVLNPR